MRVFVVTLLSLLAAVARAQAPTPTQTTPPPPQQQQTTPTTAPLPDPIVAAQQALDRGDFERVVTLLQPIVDGNPEAPGWFEALRLYGVACAVTHRRASAEGAFALMLEQPAQRLERPQAKELFATVQLRYLAAETSVGRQRRWSRELIAGTTLAALGGALGVTSLILDSSALDDQLAQSSSAWRYNGEAAAIGLTATSLVVSLAGVILLVDGARKR